jgi:hypothetical protein
MNSFYKLLIFIIINFHSRIVFSQSVDEILRGYSEAIGGRESYDTIQTYHQRVLSIANVEKSKIEKYYSAPFKFKDIITSENNKKLIYVAYNGISLKSNIQYLLDLGPNPYSKRIEEKRMGLLFT